MLGTKGEWPITQEVMFESWLKAEINEQDFPDSENSKGTRMETDRFQKGQTPDTARSYSAVVGKLGQEIVLCPVLTVSSWPAYSFLRRQVM